MERPRYICIRSCTLQKPYSRFFKMGEVLPDDFEPNKHFALEEEVKSRDEKAMH